MKNCDQYLKKREGTVRFALRELPLGNEALHQVQMIKRIIPYQGRILEESTGFETYAQQQDLSKDHTLFPHRRSIKEYDLQHSTCHCAKDETNVI